MTTNKPKRQTCTDHCSTCGRHFHGLSAFDAHRRESQCLEPGEAVTTKGRQLLQIWTKAGWCELARESWVNGARVPLHPVTIWQVATTEAQRERLAALNER